MNRKSTELLRHAVPVALCLAVHSLLLPLRASGEKTCLPGDIEKYAAKASSRSDVNLDRTMLGFAGNFMNEKDDEEGGAKQLLRQINAIVVHTYEFEQPGDYDQAGLESIRTHYQGADWSHIVSTREKSKGQPAESSDIWMHLKNGKASGMVILNAEEKELNFVCIDGTIDPAMLSQLSGHFGMAPATEESGRKKLAVPQPGSLPGPQSGSQQGPEANQ